MAQCNGYGAGARGEMGPPKCPQFHSHPWRTRLCQGRFLILQSALLSGRSKAGKSQVQPRNSARIEHIQVSLLRRVTSDTNCLPWRQWQEDPGDTFAEESVPGHCSYCYAAGPSTRLTARQNDKSIQPVTEPHVMRRMTQTFPPACCRTAQNAGQVPV